MVQPVVVEVEEDQAGDEVQVVDPLDEVVLQAEESQPGLLGEDRNAMESPSVQVDPVRVLGPLLRAPLQSHHGSLAGHLSAHPYLGCGQRLTATSTLALA